MRGDVPGWRAMPVSAPAAAFPTPVRAACSTAKSKDRDNIRRREVLPDYAGSAHEASAQARVSFAAANSARHARSERNPTQDCQERHA
jgi:hypothetical protein